MFHVALNFSLGVLALNIVSTSGTSQHLICKTVDDFFSDSSSAGRAQITPRPPHGPPGKRGQTGAKGEPGISGLKGEKGAPGFVDPQNVENVVERKWAEANRELLERIERLEESVTRLNSTTKGIVEKIPCDEGFVYNVKCYFAIIHGSKDTDHQEARSLCSAEGGTAADILNREHEILTADHVRSRTPISGNTELWIGMSYTPSTSTIRWSTGTRVPQTTAASMRWWPGWPSSVSNYDTMSFAVDSIKFGLFHYNSGSNLHGVVCEK